MAQSLIERCFSILSAHRDAPDRFELTVREVYTRLLAEGDTALDLGAHTGKHTIPMAHAVGLSGAIYAFEPILEKFRTLAARAEGERLPQAQLFNVCCSNENDIVEFVYLPEDPGKSAIKIRPELETSYVEKRIQKSICIRIDDFLTGLNDLAFVKIDVEGSEFFALQGMSSLIIRTRPVIHTEIGLPSLQAFNIEPEAIFDFFAEHGYEMVDVLGTKLVTCADYMTSITKTRVYDYFAVPYEDPRMAKVLAAINATWKG